ncbi:Mu homology domain-containing protein [Mrakia frigida]|uniref:AP-3 complex subunit mu n=1 Tax=Mrakia frigida TaxID=29902 RepID=UPI003FCC1335
MSIAGLIFLSSAGKSIISTPFRPQSLQHIYIQSFLAAQADSKLSPSSSREPKELEPVFWVGEEEGVCCWVERGGMTVLCPLVKEANPLLGFRFMEVFLEVLEEYLGEVSESTLKDNFDIVYQLLEEMLDEGSPLTTQSNILRDIVLPPSLLNKVLSVAGVSGLGPPPLHQPFSSPIPWRRPGVKHISNEIFFDFVESLDVVLDRHGQAVRTDRFGRIECNTKLSGTPDLLLTFTNPAPISTPAFHPCIRLSKFEQTSALSFVPPDGNFRLMEYAIKGPSKGRPANDDFGVKMKVRTKLSETGGTFSITVSPTHASRPVENAVVRWYLGEGVLGERVTGTVTPGGVEGEGGRWEFDGGTDTLIWRLPTLLPRSSTRTFTGSFATASSPLPAPSLLLTAKIHQHSLSNLKIAQLKVGGLGGGNGDAQPKVFRGVRGRVEVKMEGRW